MLAMCTAAEELSSRHGLNVPGMWPVDMLALARMEGFEVWQRGESLQPAGIVAVYVPDHHDAERPNVILINECLPAAMQRYGIAHELGHFFLRHIPAVVDRGRLWSCHDPRRRDSMFTDYNAQQQELEAAAFAACLIIPAMSMHYDTVEELAWACRVPVTVAELRSRMWRQGAGGWELVG